MSMATRRDLLLSAASSYAAFGLGKPIAFIGMAHAQQSPVAPFRQHKVGDIEIFSLVDGMAELPPREGFVRNANVDEMNAALRAGSMSDALIPIPFHRNSYQAWLPPRAH